MAGKNRETSKKVIDPKMRYAHMVVFLIRRASLVSWCLGTGALLAITLFPVATGVIRSWISVLPIILGVGFATLMIPPTEEWGYTPWQAEAERYEHYTRDR